MQKYYWFFLLLLVGSGLGSWLLLDSTFRSFQSDSGPTAMSSVTDPRLRWDRAFSCDIWDIKPLQFPNGSRVLVVSTLSPDLHLIQPLTGKSVWVNSQIAPSGLFGHQNSIEVTDLNVDSLPEIVTTGLIYNNESILSATQINATVTAYSATNGTALWQKIGGRYTDHLAMGKFLNTSTGLVFYTDVLQDQAMLRVLDGASGIEVWNHTYSGHYAAIYDILTCDLTQDGYDEIIISYSTWLSGELHVYNGANFSLLWNVTLAVDRFLDVKPAFIDNDNVTDFIVVGFESDIYAVNGKNGSVLWHNLGKIGGVDNAIADIDADGKLELITSRLENWTILNLQTGEIERQITLPFTFMAASLQITDLENDEKLEIIAGSFYGGVVILTNNLTLREHLPTNGPVYSLVVANYFNTATKQIVAGTLVTAGHLYMYQPTSLPSHSSSITTTSGLSISPVIVFSFFSYYLLKKKRFYRNP